MNVLRSIVVTGLAIALSSCAYYGPYGTVTVAPYVTPYVAPYYYPAVPSVVTFPDTLYRQTYYNQYPMSRACYQRAYRDFRGYIQRTTVCP